jgi:hypothetical protein
VLLQNRQPTTFTDQGVSRQRIHDRNFPRLGNEFLAFKRAAMTAPAATPPVAPATDSLKTRRFALAAWLLLLVFPWALYLVNDSWAYNHRFETAGIYTGYFLL